MPKKLEQKLKRQVAGKDWSQKRKDAYVYGTLRKTGWKPSHQAQRGMTEVPNTGLRLFRQRMRIRKPSRA
jgi:hypothetical protein